MKRKLSFASVLAMILIISGVTALATAPPNSYFESVAALEQRHGYYEDWALPQKLELLQYMEENQVAEDPQRLSALLHDGQEQLIDQYIAEIYGIDGRLDVVTLARIVTVEKGWIDTWSAQDKAWYSQMLMDYGLIGSDSYVYLLPSEEDISPETAIAIAKQAVSQQYGVTDADWSGYTASWSYQVHIQDYGIVRPYYDIRFTPSSGDQVSYGCMITGNGAVMPENEFDTVQIPAEDFDDQEAVRLFEEYAQAHPEIPADASLGGWTLEGKRYFSEVIRPVVLKNHQEHANQAYTHLHLLAAAQFIYGLPDDCAIPQESAVQIAQNALISDFSVPQEWLVYYDGVCVFYDITNPDQPLWKITMTAIGHYQEIHTIITNPYTVYKIEIDAYTGSVILQTSFDPRENDGTLSFASLFY